MIERQHILNVSVNVKNVTKNKDMYDSTESSLTVYSSEIICFLLWSYNIKFSPLGNLSFPPVDLEVVNEKGIVTFQNPLHFYDNLQQPVSSPTAVFYFNTILEDGVSSTKTFFNKCMRCIFIFWLLLFWRGKTFYIFIQREEGTVGRG